jgi:hypothetical protein
MLTEKEKKHKITLEDLYIQFCEKDHCKIFDFGTFIVGFIDGSEKSNILDKSQLKKIVSNMNKNIEDEENQKNENKD